jgi:hypothetical protein
MYLVAARAYFVWATVGLGHKKGLEINLEVNF